MGMTHVHVGEWCAACTAHGAAYNELPTSSYSWSSSQPVVTHCGHGLDLRLHPRCYLCKPEVSNLASTAQPAVADLECVECGGRIGPRRDLDAAWAAAEAALPEGWWLAGVERDGDGEAFRWQANAKANGDDSEYGDGRTPTAALLALARRLAR